VLGDTVAVGDAEGYLHFFAAETGKPVARIRVGSDPIKAAPVVVGDRLYVLGSGGEFAAVSLAKGN
jgi:outer membrane protein assembly factor BamB